MAATKSRTSIWSGQTLTAGAGNTTSSLIDLSSTYGSTVSIKLTNGSTGPTVPAQVQVVVANNFGSPPAPLLINFGGACMGGTANNGVYHFVVEIPIGVEAVELVAGSNTSQNVTVDADISSVTAL